VVWALVGAGALAACVLPAVDYSQKSCVRAEDCPPPWTCAPLRPGRGRTCELLPEPYPAVVEPLDGGGGTYCHDAKPIFDLHCTACHNRLLTQGEVRLDVYSLPGPIRGSREAAPLIKFMAYDTRQMPPSSGSTSFPTDDQRRTLALWVLGGAVECDAGTP
jgi:hypothetical protein